MLRIARMTDHALVVLAHLARSPGVVASAAVSEATGVPVTTVAKVAKTLARSGLLVSVRGANGGYGLSRSAHEIDVSQVIEAMEGPLALTACATPEDGPGCAEEHRCPMSNHWPRINGAVLSALQGVSLAELVGLPVPTLSPADEVAPTLPGGACGLASAASRSSLSKAI